MRGTLLGVVPIINLWRVGHQQHLVLPGPDVNMRGHVSQMTRMRIQVPQSIGSRHRG